GVIWAVPTNGTLVVPSGYCLIRGSFCNINPFLEEAGVRNIYLDATGYSLATEPENLNDKNSMIAGLKSPWSSQSVAQSTVGNGLAEVTDDSFKVDLRSNCFFQAGVTYYWKVWVVT
ncbi:MAG: hypothetical protein IKI63_06090, partial [Clostridia bacterium]|nr:hypothetical protein [Clostridia bacterium]